MKLKKVTGFKIICIMLLLAALVVTVRAAPKTGLQSEIQFTDPERDWLARHPRIQMGVMDAWPPLNYLDQNKIPQGIGAEYLAAMNKLLGGALVPVPGPFKENYDRVLTGQLDAIMDITQRPDREALFNFTRPYIVIPHVIVGRKGRGYFKAEQDLSGKTIALERGFYNVTYFKNNHPTVIIREYGTTSEALDAVSRGEADAYAGNRAVAIYLIKNELLNNLQLMGKLTESKSTLQIGVRKSETILASILDKVLQTIPEAEQNSIYSKWVSLEYKHKVDYSVIWKVVAIALTVMVMFFFWNRRLRREIAIRKRAEELLQANQAYLENLLEERTRTEQMLIERESQYRDLVESANSVILRWLPDGRITFFNRFARNFFGYSEEEIINRNILGTVVPAEDSSGKDLAAMVANIVAHPEAFVRNENENVRKNGERVWIAWTNKPILNADGVVSEILSIGVDITQLVHTERELRQTLDELAVAKERAETADQLKSAFLATMSHELRTPLNSIIGFTGILLQGLVGSINEEQAKQLSMVKNSANHLLSLISDILDISKIEAGQLTVASELFDLRESIIKVVQSVRPLAEKKGLDLTVAVAEDVGTISNDVRRVEQVLLNLLSNAVKFTEQGSICVNCLLEEGKYVISVTDTGIGIKDDDLERLFKPFHQIDTGLSRKYEGTGLGLSICKKLVELMGGGISVESFKEKGSKFSFMLPRERVSP